MKVKHTTVWWRRLFFKTKAKPSQFPQTVAQIEEIKASAKDIYDMDSVCGGFWGDSIKFSRVPKSIEQGAKLRVVGWKSKRPQRNDLLRIGTQSGRVWLGRFTEVELCRDPMDMFFADVVVLGLDLNFSAAIAKAEGK